MPARQKLRRRRRTKIIATLGPASSSPEVLSRLFYAGADVFRLNFSHGTHEDHAARVAMIRELEQRSHHPIGILADVQGPKLRVGQFGGGRVQLQTGQHFTLDLNHTPGDVRRVNLPHPEIIQAATIGTTLLLDDGKIRLRVIRVRDDHLETEVMVGGTLSDRKGVNIPDVVLPIPALTEKDRDDLAFALDHGVDFIGLSFVQRPEDVAEAKAIAAGRAWIMTKMEKPQALDNLEEILRLSDAVMVARGDLGVELPPERVPLLQKRIIEQASRRDALVITATQMLESMTHSPRPTRAEVSDVANAILDGTDAVMLSGETSTGEYPVEAVSMMDAIARAVESSPGAHGGWSGVGHRAHSAIHSVALAAGDAAAACGAKAILVYTLSGATAIYLSKQRPCVPVVALTPSEPTFRRLALMWGVTPLRTSFARDTDGMLARGSRAVLASGLLRPGDRVVVVSGSVHLRAGSDMMKIDTLGI